MNLNGDDMNIGIYSLGLIGGSLLKALSDEKLFAVSQNSDTLHSIDKMGITCSSDISILSNCDIVFVCSSMEHTPSVLKELDSVLLPDTIVADVCSLKSFVMKDVHPYKFIGTHPMAGTEKSGFNASFPQLFQGAKWVITPSDNVSSEDVELLVSIIEKTGAKPIFMSPQEHDESAALISHMPLIVAQGLMKSVLGNVSALNLAASGFRDMTRLAMSNTSMASDMLKYNRENILNSLNLLRNSIDELLSADYEEQIQDLSNARASLYDSDGKNSYN